MKVMLYICDIGDLKDGLQIVTGMQLPFSACLFLVP